MFSSVCGLSRSSSAASAVVRSDDRFDFGMAILLGAGTTRSIREGNVGEECRTDCHPNDTTQQMSVR